MEREEVQYPYRVLVMSGLIVSSPSTLASANPAIHPTATVAHCFWPRHSTGGVGLVPHTAQRTDTAHITARSLSFLAPYTLAVTRVSGQKVLHCLLQGRGRGYKYRADALRIVVMLFLTSREGTDFIVKTIHLIFKRFTRCSMSSLLYELGWLVHSLFVISDLYHVLTGTPDHMSRYSLTCVFSSLFYSRDIALSDIPVDNAQPDPL
ncbi:hypothetical protein J6590_021589 [Homalodisca vitripennis]|nr:hypothetical protein J6590_021589 [Homalodisca vitripennis]